MSDAHSADVHDSAPSFWLADAGDDPTPRPRLEGDGEADVVIVGAGFTGLWAAWSLTQLEPGLEVAVLEAETAGFGASGRNGVADDGGLHHATSDDEARGPTAVLAHRHDRAVERCTVERDPATLAERLARH